MSKHYLLSLGMKLDSSSLNYTWCDGRIRWNRWNYRKDKLISEGYDSSKSGNNKYIWIK